MIFGGFMSYWGKKKEGSVFLGCVTFSQALVEEGLLWPSKSY